MRTGFFVMFLIACLSCNAQVSPSQFPRTKYQLVLPDSSFHINHDSSGFFSKSYQSKIEMVMEDFAGQDYPTLVEMMLMEMSRPGQTILLDKKLEKMRL